MHCDERLSGWLEAWLASKLAASLPGARAAVRGQGFDTFPRSAVKVTSARRCLRSMDSKNSAVRGPRSPAGIMDALGKRILSQKQYEETPEYWSSLRYFVEPRTGVGPGG